MKKCILLLLTLALSIGISNAQMFRNTKMPVGVKTYSFFDAPSKFEMEFKDLKGSLDKYNFYNLDTAMESQEITIVFDRKINLWRLPLSYNEAMGIADKEGEEPLQRLFPSLGIISPAMREKIE